MMSYSTRWEISTVAVWITSEVHEICCIIFFSILSKSLALWVFALAGYHFSWQTSPNQSATDLVQITLVSEVGFQC